MSTKEKIKKKISATLGDFGIGGNLKNLQARHRIRTQSVSWSIPFSIGANRRIMNRVSKEHNLSSGAGRRSGEKQYKAIKNAEYMADNEYKITRKKYNLKGD
jgi:hypothetical protein